MKRLIADRRFQNVAAVLAALIIWQIFAMAVGQRILLASPVEVTGRLLSLWREENFFGAVAFSFVRIVGGFCLGVLCGSLFAVAAGRFRIVEIFLRPLMVTVKSVPVASFIVIALIWLSSSSLPVFISFLIVLPVVYSNVLGGIRSIPPEMSAMTEVFGMPWYRRLIYVWLPQIKPYLISACGAALGMSWKAGVAAEIIGLPSGSLGERLYEAKVYFNTVDLLAWTVVMVIVSAVFEKLFMALLRFGFGRLERL